MCKCWRLLNFVHFADDTTVCLDGRNLAQLCDVINAELVNVNAWLCSNKVSLLNIDKTAFMIYSNKSKVVNVDLTIRDQNITRVRSSKFLGLIIYYELHFEEHIKLVCKLHFEEHIKLVCKLHIEEHIKPVCKLHFEEHIKLVCIMKFPNLLEFHASCL